MDKHKMMKRSKLIETKQMLTISALQNELILSNIMRFLTLDDLKKTRQVNLQWKNEAQKWFLLRGVFKISFDKLKLMNLETDQGFGEYLKINKCHVNFDIRLHSTDSHDALRTFQGKLENFLWLHGSKICCLELMLDIYITPDFKFLFNVLRSMPKLKELALSVYFRNNKAIPADDCEDIEPLIHIKKLKVQFPFFAEIDDNEHSKLKKFTNKLVTLVPNLEFINLPPFGNRYGINYFEEFVELQLVWKSAKSIAPMPFKNLSGFSLELKNVEILLKLLQPILKLSVFESTHQKENSLHLQALLKKHAKTLKSFEFSYIIGENELHKIDLPFLPRLQHFELFVLDCAGDEEGLSTVDVFSICELFMMGGFEERFPSLQSFTMKNLFDMVVYKMILPRPNQNFESVDLCFPQFTLVDISGQYSQYHNFNHEEYCKWMIWLAKLFPNVHNPDFNKARLLNNPQILK